jgi:hypothetical protein
VQVRCKLAHGALASPRFSEQANGSLKGVKPQHEFNLQNNILVTNILNRVQLVGAAGGLDGGGHTG